MKFVLAFVLFIWVPSVFAQESISPNKISRSLVEGTLLQVSSLPPPGENAYPDCYYTAVIDLSHIVSGQSIPKNLVLVLPGFFSRQYAPESNYKVGDKVRAMVVPFASMPDNVKQTQQADEVEDTTLDYYFPENIALIQKFEAVRHPVPFADVKPSDNISVGLQQTDHGINTSRQDQIQRDLKEIDTLLAKNGGDWNKWHNSLQPFRDKYQKHYDIKAERWIGDSFFGAGYFDNKNIYRPDFVKSIIAFKNFLDARNIDLILVRVPHKGEVVDDIFTGTPTETVTNPYLLRLYKELLEADVEVITDIIPRARSERLKYPLMYWYQAFAEDHPAEGIAWVVAKAFAERVSRYDNIKNSTKTKYKLRQVSTGMDLKTYLWADLGHNPHWPSGNPKFKTDEFIKFTAVNTIDDKPLNFKIGSDSPILIVGSSYLQTPSQSLGANIPSYLAYLTGIAPEVLSRSGGDRSIPRLIVRQGDSFLKSRSVCLFPLVPGSENVPFESIAIVDPSRFTKLLQSSLSGELLQKQVLFEDDTQKPYYSYLPDGSIKLQGISKQRYHNFKFKINLPDNISEFSALTIEIDSQPGDGAAIRVNYGSETETAYKNYRKDRAPDTFTFKVNRSNNVEFTIGNIRSDIPTVISGIRIYGLK